MCHRKLSSRDKRIRWTEFIFPVLDSDFDPFPRLNISFSCRIARHVKNSLFLGTTRFHSCNRYLCNHKFREYVLQLVVMRCGEKVPITVHWGIRSVSLLVSLIISVQIHFSRYIYKPTTLHLRVWSTTTAQYLSPHTCPCCWLGVIIISTHTRFSEFPGT